MELANRLWAGAAAGFAATGPMTALMEFGGRAFRPREQGPQPPRVITERAAEESGVADGVGERELAAATMAAHLGYGTGSGALYGALSPHIPLPPVARGVAFGLGLWAAGYLGWLPAVGLYPPATRDTPARNALNVASHALWGAVLGAVEGELAGRSRRSTTR
jgi:hypothetical protein